MSAKQNKTPSLFFTKSLAFLSSEWRFFVKPTGTVTTSSKFSFCVGVISEQNKFHFYVLTHFFDILWWYDFSIRWVLSLLCSTSSVPAFTDISTMLSKTSPLLLLDTCGMSSILIHERLLYCSNSSISLYSLTFACFRSKIWFWNIHLFQGWSSWAVRPFPFLFIF